MARRIGVRAQFGAALLAFLTALGRIVIRPQICYCLRTIGADGFTVIKVAGRE